VQKPTYRPRAAFTNPIIRAPSNPHSSQCDRTRRPPSALTPAQPRPFLTRPRRRYYVLYIRPLLPLTNHGHLAKQSNQSSAGSCSGNISARATHCSYLTTTLVFEMRGSGNRPGDRESVEPEACLRGLLQRSERRAGWMESLHVHVRGRV